MELIHSKESAISQIVRMIPSKMYLPRFSMGDAMNTCKGSMIVEAFARKETIKVPFESMEPQPSGMRHSHSQQDKSYLVLVMTNIQTAI